MVDYFTPKQFRSRFLNLALRIGKQTDTESDDRPVRGIIARLSLDHISF